MDEQKSPKKNALVAKLIIDLSSLDEAKMIKAIDELREHGDATVIDTLANVYAESTSRVKHLIVDLIGDIRFEEAAEALIKAVQQTNNEETRTAFLSAIWSSSLDFSDAIASIVELAINGRFEDTIECYTIIMNMAGPFDEDRLLEAKMNLKSNFESFSHHQQKFALLTDILQRLNEFDQEL